VRRKGICARIRVLRRSASWDVTSELICGPTFNCTSQESMRSATGCRRRNQSNPRRTGGDGRPSGRPIQRSSIGTVLLTGFVQGQRLSFFQHGRSRRDTTGSIWSRGFASRASIR
jgi:hypothetical protein